jgi:glycosyltransferase involved in cell wall biosynthesis
MTYHLGIAFRVIRKAKHLICVSPYTAEHIKKLFFPKGNVTVIPNGLPDETFGRGKKRISSMRPASSVFTLCSIGSWGNLKNIKALLKAYGMLREKHPDTRLVLFGSQLGCQEMAEKWAHTHHLDKGVEFRGFAAREQLLDFLEFEADLMVHPSKIETHGMVLIEAMACGVPVVAGEQSGAVAWTLDHGKSGILCNIRRPADIAHAIEQIILNPHAMREIIHHAWSSTYERFRIVDCASANEKILMEVAKTNISSPCE